LVLELLPPQPVGSTIAAMEPLGWRNYANLIAYLLNFVATFATQLSWFPGEDNGTLSEKYQTLITPDGATFAIWAIIFVGEAVFAVCQMLPRYRSSKVVEAVTPGWVLACAAQVLWSVVFAQEFIVSSVVCMFTILLGLMWVSASTDGMAMSWEEYAVLRWVLSVHLGWIACASAVNANVLFDFQMASPEMLLSVGVTSIGALCILGTIFALVKKSPEPIVNLVAAWAFAGISRELSIGGLLNDPSRHNPYTWNPVTLAGLQLAATNLQYVSLGLAAIAAVRALVPSGHAGSAAKGSDHEQELVESPAQGA